MFYVTIQVLSAFTPKEKRIFWTFYLREFTRPTVHSIVQERQPELLHKRWNRKRSRVWVQDVLRRRTQLGDFHQRLHFQANQQQFDEPLGRIGAMVSLLDAN